MKVNRVYEGVVGTSEQRDADDVITQSIYDIWEQEKKKLTKDHGVDYWFQLESSVIESVLIGSYCEVTEEVWQYFLEVLPPLNWTSYGFQMCERLTDDITSTFLNLRINDKDRWFHVYCRDNTSSMADAIAAITAAES